MNREIKFRGKRRDNGKWVYGLPAYTSGGEIGKVAGWTDDGDDAVGAYFEVEVISETVGQFTGLKDKEGKEIYEGDCLLCFEFPSILIVGFNEASASFCGSKTNNFETYNCFWFYNDIVIENDGWLVIGNITDNPELLKQ